MRFPAYLLSILVLTVFLSGCNETHSTTPVVHHDLAPGPRLLKLTDHQLKEIGLTTVPVEARVLPELIELVGQVDENDYLSTPVNSFVPGRVEKVEVQVGDRVRKGQIISEIRSDEVARIESELIKSVLEYEADIARTRVDLEVARKALNRHQQLFEEGIGARAHLEAAQGEFEKAQAALKALEEKRRSAIAVTTERLELYGIPRKEMDRLLRTRVTDNLFDVFSPREGIVVSRDVDIGQLVDVSHEMFRVSDLSQVWVDAQAFEKDIEAIELGEPVIVKVESYPGRTFTGKVDFIGSILDAQSRTLQIRATVANPDLKLRPKMYARMEVKTGEKRGIVVPAAAIRKTGEAYLAYVVQGPGAFEERKVETGPVMGEQMIIKSGLSSGEKVVLKGSLELNGLAVKQAGESETQ